MNKCNNIRVWLVISELAASHVWILSWVLCRGVGPIEVSTWVNNWNKTSLWSTISENWIQKNSLINLTTHSHFIAWGLFVCFENIDWSWSIAKNLWISRLITTCFWDNICVWLISYNLNVLWLIRTSWYACF